MVRTASLLYLGRTRFPRTQLLTGYRGGGPSFHSRSPTDTARDVLRGVPIHGGTVIGSRVGSKDVTAGGRETRMAIGLLWREQINDIAIAAAAATAAHAGLQRRRNINGRQGCSFLLWASSIGNSGELCCSGSAGDRRGWQGRGCPFSRGRLLGA